MFSCRKAFAAVAVLAAILASHASAFDTSPHFDVSRDALQAEGFGNNAIRLAQTNNWFVDLYENYEKLPNSGHSGALLRFLRHRVLHRELGPSRRTRC